MSSRNVKPSKNLNTSLRILRRTGQDSLRFVWQLRGDHWGVFKNRHLEFKDY